MAAALWLVSRFVHAYATRKAEQNLLAGKRNTAMGAVAATSLGSAWMMSLGVIIAGIFSRDVGL